MQVTHIGGISISTKDAIKGNGFFMCRTKLIANDMNYIKETEKRLVNSLFRFFIGGTESLELSIFFYAMLLW